MAESLSTLHRLPLPDPLSVVLINIFCFLKTAAPVQGLRLFGRSQTDCLIRKQTYQFAERSFAKSFSPFLLTDKQFSQPDMICFMTDDHKPASFADPEQLTGSFRAAQRFPDIAVCLATFQISDTVRIVFFLDILFIQFKKESTADRKIRFFQNGQMIFVLVFHCHHYKRKPRHITRSFSLF